MKSWTKIVVLLGGVFLLLFIFAGRWVAGDRIQRITLGPDTTVITTPLMADGRVDYLAAINEKYAAGVTAENNAGILIAEMIPADQIFPSVVEAMGIKAGVGPLFEPYQKFEERRTGQKFGQSESGKISDALDELAKGPWKKEEHAEEWRWLVEQEPVAQKLELASRRLHLYMPRVRNSPSDTLMESVLSTPLGAMRDMARMESLRAMEKLEEGDLEGAWAESMTIQRLGRLVCQQPTVIEYLVGVAIVSKGNSVQEAIIGSGKMTAQEAKTWKNELEALGEMPSIIPTLDCEERWGMLDQVTLLATYGPDISPGAPLPPRANSFSFGVMPVSFNAILRAINHFSDERTAAASQARYVDREAKLLDYQNDVNAFVAAHGGASGSSVTGRMVGLLMSYDFRNTLRLRDAVEQDQLLIQDGLRGAIYFMEHGRTQETQRVFASQLRPTIMEEMPPKIDFTNDAMILSCDGPERLKRGRQHFEVKVILH